MSETFETILVKYDRLNVTSKAKYSVFKGAQSNTAQPFKAISQTTSNHVYNITCPSLETIVSREVLWKSTVTFKISNPTKSASEFCVNYGVTDALAAFPLHSLVQTITAQINNHTVTCNMQDTLPILLRLMDPEELAKYDCMTPTTLDYDADYRSGVKRMEYQLTRTLNADGQLPRPAILDVGTTETVVPDTSGRGFSPYSYISYPNNVLAYDMNRIAGSSYCHKPRGTFKIKAIYANPTAPRTPQIADTDVYVKVEITEPLLLSPFTFGSQAGKQGFYGISNMTLNMTANANRAWRSAVFSRSKSVVVDSFEESQLLFQFLTPKPSDLLEARNVVPFYTLPIYRTANISPLTAIPRVGQPDATGSFPVSASTTVISNSIQLSGIPDKLIICVRKVPGRLSPSDADNYATILNVSLNFNNQAGLLSTLTHQQLFKASVQSGLASMSWEEFNGHTISVCGAIDGTALSQQAAPFRGVGSNQLGGNNPGVQYIATTGSIVVLNLGEAVELCSEYLAPGSIGSFNLQVQVQVENRTNTDWATADTEMIVMCMESGLLVNERGTTSSFIHLLTKQDILSSLDQVPYSKSEVHRMVGGGLLDNLKSSLGWLSSKIAPVLPYVKTALQAVPHAYAQTGARVLDSLGYGAPGNRKKIENRVM